MNQHQPNMRELAETLRAASTSLPEDQAQPVDEVAKFAPKPNGAAALVQTTQYVSTEMLKMIKHTAQLAVKDGEEVVEKANLHLANCKEFAMLLEESGELQAGETLAFLQRLANARIALDTIKEAFKPTKG